MKTPDFTTTLLVSQTAKDVFAAINHVRGWWSEEIEGDTNKLNAVFDYHFEDVHRCQMKITEMVPAKKVVWQVLENYFKFTKDVTEWTGTSILFEISEMENQTQLKFTHEGLNPALECYEICRDAWTNYIQNSLRNLIETGKGQPNAAGKPQTADEVALSSAHR